MKKNFFGVFLFAALGMVMSAPMVFADINRNVIDAVKLGYNFRFNESSRLLEDYIKKNPDSLDGYAGRIIYDFLIINQDSDRDNIDLIILHLKELEEKADIAYAKSSSIQNRFYQCFTDYYLMKSYALTENWVKSFTHASRARTAALELKPDIEKIPDLYFIIGDQDYSSSLAPGGLKSAMKFFDFNPERANSLAMIETAMKKGQLVREEAKMYYISSCLYVEKKYPAALGATDDFLAEFPDNLSARYYKIDILLRMQDTAQAQALLDSINKGSMAALLKGKWAARNEQMKGNIFNAKGNYSEALEFYHRAVDSDNLSNYTYTEITLEMGKLYDVLGKRKEAREWFWSCEKSSGLVIQREEARILRQDGYSSTKGSY